MINEAMWDAAIDEAATAAAGAKPRRANGNTQNAHTMPVYEPSGTERNGYDADRFKWETADTTKGPVLNSLWLVKGVLPRHGTGALAESCYRTTVQRDGLPSTDAGDGRYFPYADQCSVRCD